MRYLLGKLSEQEMTEFEAQCFEDDNLFHEVTDLENDLLHSYVRSELSRAESKEFEAGYLITPARQRKVEFVQALEHHLFRTDERSTNEDQRLARRPAWVGFAVPGWRVMVVSGVAALVALITIFWLAVMNNRLKSELHQTQAQQTELRHSQQELEAKLAALTARLEEINNQPQYSHPSGPLMMAFSLAPGSPRSADRIQHLTVPARVLRIELNLYLEDDKYAAFRASLQTVAGKQIWRKTAMKGHADGHGRQIVSSVIPSHLLPSGDYVVRLAGVTGTGEVEEDIAAYRFVVARR